jgi:ribosomal protein S18 acetylase RimI-like enzyme
MRTFSKTTPALVASLIGDPFYQAITVDCGVDVEDRFWVLSRYFEYSLQEADRTGRCTVHENPGLGAAAWLLPRTPEVEVAEASAKAAYLAGLLGPKGWDNYRRIIEFMSHRSELVVPLDAWYLTIVGVHPGAQGRGIGAQLVRPTLAEATKARACAFLETFTQRGRAFYERIGFVRVAESSNPLPRLNMLSCCVTPNYALERAVVRGWLCAARGWEQGRCDDD